MRALEHSDWVKIAESPEFVELHQRKTRFLFGWWICATLFFFCIPLGAGYLPNVFEYKVIGNINFAYTLVIFTFFASWLLSVLYMIWANKVSDPLTAQVVEKLAKKLDAAS
jgi:uncharacterized membrane protein (DUF485 family)